MALFVAMCSMLPATAQSLFSKLQFDSLTHRLQGTWMMPTAKGLLEETWGKPAGNLQKGSSYRINQSDTTWLEHIELTFAAGVISYTPTTAGQNDGKPVPFVLESLDSGRWLFSNPQHDFPQRILYRFAGPDSIHARIEGMMQGALRSVDFYYQRKK